MCLQLWGFQFLILEKRCVVKVTFGLGKTRQPQKSNVAERFLHLPLFWVHKQLCSVFTIIMVKLQKLINLGNTDLQTSQLDQSKRRCGVSYAKPPCNLARLHYAPWNTVNCCLHNTYPKPVHSEALLTRLCLHTNHWENYSKIYSWEVLESK